MNRGGKVSSLFLLLFLFYNVDSTSFWTLKFHQEYFVLKFETGNEGEKNEIVVLLKESFILKIKFYFKDKVQIKK